MSFGSHHHRQNWTHAGQLTRLLREPDAQRMWQRPYRVLTNYDCPDGAGYSVLGDLYFIDPAIAEAIQTGKLTVPGLDATQIMECLLRHERIEKTLLDADNKIAFYPAAHEYATCGEHELVLFYKAKPGYYEDALDPLLKIVENKKVIHPHVDLDAAPYLDDPDRTDLKILSKLRRAGVKDAMKLGRHEVHYRKGNEKGKCWACKHYQPVDEIRGPCEGVEGLVLGRMLCDRFAAKPAVAESPKPAVQAPAAGPAPTALAAQPQAAAPTPGQQAAPTKPEASVESASPAPPPTPAAQPPQQPPTTPAPAPQPTPQPPSPPSPAAPAAPVPQPPPEPTPAVAMPAAAQGPLAATLGGGAQSPISKAPLPPPTPPQPPQAPQSAAIEKMAEAIKELAQAVESRPIQVNVTLPKSKSKKISTRRGPDGNLVAHVEDQDDE